MIRKVILGISIIILGLFCNLQSIGQAKQPYLFFLGAQSYVLGNLENAHNMFFAVLAENPTHSPSYYYLSRVSVELGEPHTAKRYIDEALRIDSSNTQYLNHKAQLLIELKDYKAAEDVIIKLIEKEPSNQKNYLVGAYLMLETNKADKAIELCEKFEQLYGIDEKMVDVQRMAYITNESYYAAEGYMQRVVSAYPENIEFIVSLAEINAALRHDSVALALLDRATIIDPTSVDVLLARTNYYKITKQNTKFIESLIPLFRSADMPVEKKIAIFKSEFMTPEPYRENFSLIAQLMSTLLLTHTDNNDVRLLYGYYLTYTGQIDAALEHYSATVEQFGLNEELTERILEIYFYQKEYDKSKELARRAYNSFKKSKFIESEAVADWLAKRIGAAIKRLNEGLKLFKDDSIRSSFYAMQGDIYHQEEKMKKCYLSYDKSLKLNPNNEVVLNNYAYFLSLEGRELNKALTMSKRANELSPSNPTYLDTEAWVLFKLGQYTDAQILMRRVFALDGNPSGEVLMHYGDILYELGDDFLARNYWRKAQDAGADSKEIEERNSRPKAVKKIE